MTETARRQTPKSPADLDERAPTVDTLDQLMVMRCTRPNQWGGFRDGWRFNVRRGERGGFSWCRRRALDSLSPSRWRSTFKSFGAALRDALRSSEVSLPEAVRIVLYGGGDYELQLVRPDGAVAYYSHPSGVASPPRYGDGNGRS